MNAEHFTKAQIELAATRFNRMGAEEKADTAEFLADLKIPLIEVWFYTKQRTWVDERHIAADTLHKTIQMSLDRKVGSHALLCRSPERWELIDRGGKRSRFYETREAAEMVAIHHG